MDIFFFFIFFLVTIVFIKFTLLTTGLSASCRASVKRIACPPPPSVILGRCAFTTYPTRRGSSSINVLKNFSNTCRLCVDKVKNIVVRRKKKRWYGIGGGVGGVGGDDYVFIQRNKRRLLRSFPRRILTGFWWGGVGGGWNFSVYSYDYVICTAVARRIISKRMRRNTTTTNGVSRRNKKYSQN